MASKHGINEAFIIQQFQVWLDDSGTEIDGLTWVYGCLDDLAELLPFMSKRTIERALPGLYEHNIIKKKRYAKGDLTGYTMPDYSRESKQEQIQTTETERDYRFDYGFNSLVCSHCWEKRELKYKEARERDHGR